MKRLLALFISVVLCLSCVIPAHAAGNATMTLEASSASGYGGDEITISVRMTANAMGGLQTNLTWNDGYLTYVEGSAAFAAPFKAAAMIAQVNARDNSLRLVYASPTGYTAEDEVVFSARFRLSEGVNGTTTFALTDTKLTDAASSVNAMAVSVQNTSVRTQEYDPGTANISLSCPDSSDRWPVVGESITVQLSVRSSGAAVGSVQGLIEYDPTLLELEPNGVSFTDTAEEYAFAKTFNTANAGEIQFVYAAVEGVPTSPLLEMRFKVGGTKTATIGLKNVKATNAEVNHLEQMTCQTSNISIYPKNVSGQVTYTLQAAPGVSCADDIITLMISVQGAPVGGMQGTLTYDAEQLEYVSGSAAFLDAFTSSADIKMINDAMAGQIKMVYANGQGYTPKGDDIFTVQFRRKIETNFTPVELTNLKTTTPGDTDLQEITSLFIQEVEWETGLHTIVDDPAVAATCTTPGKTAGKHCSVCNDVFVSQESVGVLGHNVETWNETKKATCQAAGEKQGACTRENCGTIVSEIIPQVVHADGYKYTHSEAVDATCIADGHSAYDYCEKCGIEIGKTVYPMGTADVYHAYQNMAKDATCTESGLTEAYQCTRCGAWKNGVEAEVIPAGHTIVKVDAKAKSCTEKGWNAYEYCSACDYTTYVEIPASHELTQVDAKAKTCTEKGWNAYEYCSACDYTTYVEIPASHELTQVDAKAKTCTEKGWNAYEYCSACDYTTYVEIPASHELTQVDAKAKSCTEKGWNAYEYCSACDYTTYVEIPASHELTQVDAKAATCTDHGWNAYEYCTVDGCGHTTYVEIPAGHTNLYTYTEGQDPTCYASGHAANAEQCLACGMWTRGFLSKVPHDVDVVSTKAATCYADGEIISECEWYDGVNCTERTVTEITERPEHNITVFVESKGVKETSNGWVLVSCIEGGYVTYKCANAGCTETKTTTFNAKDVHQDIKVDEAKAATCTATGLTEGSHCDACGVTIVEQKEIPATNHANAAEKIVEATCYSIGHGAGSIFCPDCNTWTVDYPIAKKEHSDPTNIVEVDRRNATCTETGEIFYECKWYNGTDCTLAYSEPIDALGHEWEREGAVENYQVVTPATCYAKGLETWKCCDCDEFLSREITMIDHNYDDGVATGAEKDENGNWVTLSCTENGSVLYTCQNAGCTADTSATHTYEETVKAPGHTWDPNGHEPATCVTAGHASICSACGFVPENAEIKPLGHDYKVVGTNVTGNDEDGWTLTDCTVAGYVERTCQREGCTDETEGHYEKVNIDAKASHTWGDWEITKAATCTAEGSKQRECDKCECNEVEKIDIVEHPYGEEQTLAATCGKDGKIYKICSACGHENVIEILTATGNHTWKLTDKSVGVKEVNGEYVTTSCTVDGTADLACTGCDATDSKAITAPGHAYGEEITIEATCGADGKIYKICGACGHENVIEVLTATGNHTWVLTDKSVGVVEVKGENGEVTYKATNCAGGTAALECSVCKQTETITVEAKDHVFGDWKITIEQKCETKGERQRDCENCDFTDVEELSKLNHAWVTIPAKDAVCGTAGQTGGIQCSRCQSWNGTPSEEITALEHKYNEGVITTKPTCTEKGVKTFTCTQPGCTAAIEGHSYTEEVKENGHTSEDVPEVKVTCTTDGCTAGTKCSVCGVTLSGCEVIKHEGHKEETIPAVEVTCKEDGYTAGVKCSVCKEELEAPVLTEKAHHLGLTQVAAQTPECEKIGWEAYEYCTKCDYTTYNELPALEHKKVTVKGYAETCTEAGLTDGEQCELCEKWFVEQKEIPAKGHSWDAGVVTRKPTTTVEGVLTYTCVACKTTKTERIPIRVPGDANSDGKVDLNDALLVFEYGSGKNVSINLYNADVNQDGRVDAQDALLIMQYVSGWDVKLK